MSSKSIAFTTLGCKLNFSESSTFARDFMEKGFAVVPASKKADVYVINTCSVTEHADKKCRNIIRKLHRLSSEAVIVVTGCYAQLKPQEVAAIEGVDLVIGAEEKSDLVEETVKWLKDRDKIVGVSDTIFVEDDIVTFFPAYSSGDRTRSFLKVQDGCDYRCTYCTVPNARGISRNMAIDKVVLQAEAIAATGIKEIVLTGVNTGDFGKTTGESFQDLLKALNNVHGVERYRISSIEPNLLSKEIIEWIVSGTKFLPHFHIPLQSGSDKILKAMHRRYTTRDFARKIALIRENIELPFLGIDVIVGFPGESEADFEDTYRFLEEIRPSFIHVFPYSRRENTPAWSMPEQVTEKDKKIRVERLTALSDRLHQEFYDKNRGREDEVLFESSVRNGVIFGYSRNYIRVERAYDKSVIGKIIKMEL